MRSIIEWALTHDNKNIGIVTPTHDILKYVHLEMLRKLTSTRRSFVNSTRNKITISNGARIFIESVYFNNAGVFRGLSLDVILFHEDMAVAHRHEIERIMVPQIGRGCMVGTLTT